MKNMDNVVDKITKFTQMRYMDVLLKGFTGVSAISIIGSFFTLLKSIPFQPYLDFLASTGIGDLLSIPVMITSDVISLYLVFSMAFYLANSFNINGFSPALISLGAFLVLTPFTTNAVLTTEAGEKITQAVSGVIPLSAIGATGMFLALITAFTATRLYIFFLDRGWRIKLPDTVPPNVSRMFESMLPGGLCFSVFLVIRYIMSLTPYGTAQTLIYNLLQAPLAQVTGGLGGLLVYIFMGAFLWIFGIHGGMVAYAAMAPIVRLMATENASAFAAGLAAVHPEWAFAQFIKIGGTGATLALNVLMISKLCKSQQYKSLGKLSIATSLFNINEPIIFGTPIVMNPILAIPFVGVPIVNVLLSVLGNSLGIFVPTGAGVNTFMPFFLFGALLTSSLGGAIWAILIFIVDLVLWYPFFKIMDNQTYKKEREAEKLKAEEEKLVEQSVVQPTS